MNRLCLLAMASVLVLACPKASLAGPNLYLDLSTDSIPSPGNIARRYDGLGPRLYAFLVVSEIDSIAGVCAGLDIVGQGVDTLGGFICQPGWANEDTVHAGLTSSDLAATECPAVVGYWPLLLRADSSPTANLVLRPAGGRNGAEAYCVDKLGRALAVQVLGNASINEPEPPLTTATPVHALRDSANCKVIFMTEPGVLDLPPGLTGAPLTVIQSMAEPLRAAFEALAPVQIEKCIPGADPSDSIYVSPTGMVSRRPPLWNAYRAIVARPGQADSLIACLRNTPGIRYAEPCVVFQPATNDPYFGSQWHLDNQSNPGRDLSAPEAWTMCTGSADVSVCIIDSGVYKQHEDLSDRPIQGDDGLDTETGRRGHGTLCTGAAFSVVNNGKGLSPVDWNATVLAGYSRYFHCDGLADNIYRAVEWQSNIISMSWTSNTLDGDPGLIRDALLYAYFSNVGLVASGGNADSSDPEYPAAYSFVNAIAGTDRYDDDINGIHGPWIDLAAPGDAVVTTCWPGKCTEGDGKYVAAEGTSISAPLVAACAGVVLAAHPGLFADDAFEILERTADDLGADGYDEIFGHGRVNLEHAVQYATGPIEFWHRTTGPMTVHSVTYYGLQAWCCVPTGWYRVYCYELHADEAWTESVEIEDGWVRGAGTFGTSGDYVGGCGYPWGLLESYDETGYQAKTFVYELRNLDDEFVKWMPCAPQDARVSVTLVTAPIGASVGGGEGAAEADLRLQIVGGIPSGRDVRIAKHGVGSTDAKARIDIIDASGRLVKHVGSVPLGGDEIVEWNCRSDGGRRVAAGVYFVRATSAGVKPALEKLVLLP